MEKTVDDGKVWGEEEKRAKQGGRGTRGSPCASLDDTWGKLDKQADRRKQSSLSITMARANVQKAKSHSVSLPPPRVVCLQALSSPPHFPPVIPLKLTKPMSWPCLALTSTQDSRPFPQAGLGMDTEEEGF